jgi:coenzyme F420 hydrogenase subunit beta
MSFKLLHYDVIEPGLCARCGVCAGVCPTKAIGFDCRSYPRLVGKCTNCGYCNHSCPGAEVDFNALSKELFGRNYDPHSLLGTQEQMFVGYPTDEAIRREGASGGLTTGLLAYLLKTDRIKGAVVIGHDPDKPWQFKSVLATSREQIVSAAKSKYCIVPSMSVLADLHKKEGPFAVVGLPCQVHGLRKIAAVYPKLANKIKYIFGLYCHYNMEKDAYLNALKTSGIAPGQVAQFQFRGGGWPGGFWAKLADGTEKMLHPSILYKDVMSIMLRLYGAERCFMCTDAANDFADLGMGDFWATDYKKPFSELTSCTLVSQRTATGRDLLNSAVDDGAVKLYELPAERYSKRILNYCHEKKIEGHANLRRRRAKSLPVPDYHYDLPAINVRQRLTVEFYRSTRLLRGPRRQRVATHILFSPLGSILNQINQLRKKLFLGLEGN